MTKKLLEKLATETSGSFWDEMRNAFTVDSAIDTVLQDRTLEGPNATSMRTLTEKFRNANALELPQPAGTRVKFLANLGSVLSYEDIPSGNLEGTIITVKTAEGKATHREGRVFVLWDDGKFRPIMAEHLRLASQRTRVANVMRMVTANLGDLSGLFKSSEREDELIHKATKDLWSFRQEKGQYVIERLFDDTGKPLKV